MHATYAIILLFLCFGVNNALSECSSDGQTFKDVEDHRCCYICNHPAKKELCQKAKLTKCCSGDYNITQHESNLQFCNEIVTAKVKEIDECKANLNKSNIKIDNQNLNISQTQLDLKERKKQLETKVQENEQCNKKLNESNSIIQDQSISITQNQLDLQERKMQVENKTKEIEQYKKSLNESSTKIKNKVKEIEQCKKKLNESRTKIKNKNYSISQLDSNLKLCNEKLTAKNKELGMKNSQKIGLLIGLVIFFIIIGILWLIMTVIICCYPQALKRLNKKLYAHFVNTYRAENAANNQSCVTYKSSGNQQTVTISTGNQQNRHSENQYLVKRDSENSIGNCEPETVNPNSVAESEKGNPNKCKDEAPMELHTKYPEPRNGTDPDESPLLQGNGDRNEEDMYPRNRNGAMFDTSEYNGLKLNTETDDEQ